MKDPSSSAGDSTNSREDQSCLPSSGAQDSGDGDKRAKGNASMPNGSGCSGIPRGGGGTEEDEKPPQDPEQEAEGEESQFLEFDPTVPFLSFMDAEIAHMYLTQNEESLEGAVHRELRVAGSDLVIRVTSEDSGLFYGSISFLLSQLSTVVTALRFFVPEFFRPHL